jgi:hypothetical protein
MHLMGAPQRTHEFISVVREQIPGTYDCLSMREDFLDAADS